MYTAQAVKTNFMAYDKNTVIFPFLFQQVPKKRYQAIHTQQKDEICF